MSRRLDYIEFDQLEESGSLRVRNAPGRKKNHKQVLRAPQPSAPASPIPLVDREEHGESFRFTYQASRHEEEWIRDSLGGFYEQHWFDDILRLVRGGKEASVYLAKANPTTPDVDFIAAKVYRPRMFRNLRKDHMYREGRDRLDSSGRVVVNDGMNHAMDKKTGYGLELLHTSWLQHEFQTLSILFEAGADVPKPYASSENAILMEYIGWEDLPAPALCEVELTAAEARRLFDRVIWNIETMLRLNKIHGDLSAYNILYCEDEITIIDFPQAIHPERNPNALRIFERDVTRVCEYFSSQGVSCQPRKLVADLWTGYHHRLTPELDPRFLDADSDEDRKLWQAAK